jgi:hypothetical protein
MPIVSLSVPDDQHADLLDALKRLGATDAEVVEDTGEPGRIGLRFAESVDQRTAAHRAGQIIDGANEIAGRKFDVHGTTEAGWAG